MCDVHVESDCLNCVVHASAGVLVHCLKRFRRLLSKSHVYEHIMLYERPRCELGQDPAALQPPGGEADRLSSPKNRKLNKP